MSTGLYGLRAQDEASRTREKLSILQEKYRRTKDKTLEYNEVKFDCATTHAPEL